MRNRILRTLARPTSWLVATGAIATVDFLVPPSGLDACVLHLALLPIAWRLLHRRYVPLVTGALIVAAVAPGVLTSLINVLTGPSSELDRSLWLIEPVRLWTILGLVTAGLFHRNLQHSRRRRLSLRRELQQRVRRRTNQLQRVNAALRNEIARREETQHLLDRSETNFQALIDRMQLQVLRKDQDGVITYANDTFCHHLGRSPAEVVGSTDEDMYPAELAASYRADDLRVMSTGQAVDHVEQHPSLDGQTGYVQVFKAPEYDQTGRCTGIQVIFWDITQKHRSEIALRNSEARKRALFESAGDAVLLVDHRHRIVEANPSATLLFHQPVPGMVNHLLEEVATLRRHQAVSEAGRPASGSVTPDLETAMTLAWEALPKAERCEVTMARSDGTTFESEVWLHPVPIGDSQGLAIIVRDVTLRRQAFDALREAKAAAEAASRTKSEFMAGVSHELRTPLGGIIGLSELLSSTPLSPRGRQYVEMIHHSASLLGDVIEDILDFSALEAGRVQITPAPLDLHAIVGDAFKTLAARAIGKPIHMIYSIDPSTPRFVIADAKRLRQIVINLAANAVKFTLRGEVHVRLSVISSERAGDADDHQLSHGAQATAQAEPGQPPSPQPETRQIAMVVLDVIDTGVGIPADKQQRVFDAFERGEAGTRRRFGGTGLGLSISDGLVRRMGGRIELESRPQVGSRFRCLLPLEVVESRDERGAPSLISDHLIVRIQDGTLLKALTEMIDGLPIQIHRQKSRDAESSQPHLWLVDCDSPDVSEPERYRASGDTVVWVTRLGDAPPDLAAPQDAILVEPILPHELLVALSDDRESANTDAAVTARLHDLSTKLNSDCRLLLVDDSEVNRVLLHDQLTAAGYSVEMAVNGTEAIQKARHHHYACILMDLQMPDMDGTDATRAIRDLYHRQQREMPPTIALTAHVTEEHRQQCLNAGMDGFLTKPIDRRRLLSTLSELVAGTPVAPQPMPETSTLAPEAPEWHRRLSHLAGHDPETIRSVCEAFLEEVPMLLRRIEASAEKSDLPVLARSLHTLKSCLRHVASEREIALAQQLESQAQAAQPIAPEKIAELQKRARHWIDEVRQFRDSHSAIATRPGYEHPAHVSQ